VFNAQLPNAKGGYCFTPASGTGTELVAPALVEPEVARRLPPDSCAARRSRRAKSEAGSWASTFISKWSGRIMDGIKIRIRFHSDGIQNDVGQHPVVKLSQLFAYRDGCLP